MTQNDQETATNIIDQIFGELWPGLEYTITHREILSVARAEQRYPHVMVSNWEGDTEAIQIIWAQDNAFGRVAAATVDEVITLYRGIMKNSTTLTQLTAAAVTAANDASQKSTFAAGMATYASNNRTAKNYRAAAAAYRDARLAASKADEAYRALADAAEVA